MDVYGNKNILFIVFFSTTLMNTMGEGWFSGGVFSTGGTSGTQWGAISSGDLRPFHNFLSKCRACVVV